MAKEINIRDPLRYFVKGTEIANVFKEKGLTVYRSLVLMNLYIRELSPQKLKELARVENEDQFNSAVIMPLKNQKYIKNAKLPSRNLSITQKGKSLVEEVLKELGY